METPRRRAWPAAVAGVLAVVVGVTVWTAVASRACRGPATPAPRRPRPTPRAEATTETRADLPDPDQVLAWGPTAGELTQAQALVAGSTPEQLAGQVIVGRYPGTDPRGSCARARPPPGRRLRDQRQRGGRRAGPGHHGGGQGAVADDARPCPRSSGSTRRAAWSPTCGRRHRFPAFAGAGAAIAADPATGEQAVTDAARATALELRQLGFTWVFAPVADVTIGPPTPTIGSRSASSDPALAAAATAAAVGGTTPPGWSPRPSTSRATAARPPTATDAAGARGHARGARGPRPAAVRGRRRRRRTGGHGQPPRRGGARTGDAGEPGPGGLRPSCATTSGSRASRSPTRSAWAPCWPREPAVRRPQRRRRPAADAGRHPRDPRGWSPTAIASGEVTRERAEEAAARVVALQLWQQRRASAPSPPTSRWTAPRRRPGRPPPRPWTAAAG